MYCGFCGDDAGNHSICPSCGRKVGHTNEPKRKAPVQKVKPAQSIRPAQRSLGNNTGTRVPKLLVVVLLFVFPILGLVLVPFSDFEKKTKVGIFVVIGVIFFVGFMAFMMVGYNAVSDIEYVVEEVAVEVKEETPSEVSEEAVPLSLDNISQLSDEKMDMIIEYTVTFDNQDFIGLTIISENTTLDDTETMYMYSVLKALGMSYIKEFEVSDNEYLIKTTEGNDIVVNVDNDLLVSIELDGNVLFSVDEGIIDRINE